MKDFSSGSTEQQPCSIRHRSCPWLEICWNKWICSLSCTLRASLIKISPVSWLHKGEEKGLIANEADHLNDFLSPAPFHESFTPIIFAAWASWLKAYLSSSPSNRHTDISPVGCPSFYPKIHLITFMWPWLHYDEKQSWWWSPRRWQCKDSRTRDRQNWGEEESL